MNFRIVMSFIVCAALFFVGCEQDELTPLDNTANLTEAELAEAPKVETLQNPVTTVATIKTNGHTIFFDDLGEEGLVMREQLPNTGSDPESLLDQFGEDVNPFEVFTALTKASVAVPQAIANTADATTLATSERTIDAQNTPFVGDASTVNEVESRSCYDEGYYGFRNKRCGIASSFTTDFKFCDNGRWTSHVRNSYYAGNWRAVKKVETWTNTICGLTNLKYYYYYNNRWYQYYSAQLPNGIWRIVIHSGSNRYRQSNRSNASGTFRAYTRFYN